MKCLIIINHGSERDYNIHRLEMELFKKKIEYKICYGSDRVDVNGYDFIITKSAHLLIPTYLRLKNAACKVCNKPEVAVTCQDKWATYNKFNGIVRQPLTSQNPLDIGFPMVIKNRYSSLGKKVWLVQNQEEFDIIMSKHFYRHPEEAIFQEFIPCGGKHYRILVIGNAVIGGMLVHSANGDFKSNVNLGGKSEPIEPTQEMIDMVLACQAELGADWIGYDILVGYDGNTYLCEANANAFTKAFDATTKLNSTQMYIDYIISTLNGGNE